MKAKPLTAFLLYIGLSMRTSFSASCFLGLFLALSSCGLYRQNVVNTPLFQHKGQLRLGGHISSAGREAHGALSLTNHIGILGNAGSTGVSTRENTQTIHHFAEVGIGLFKKSEPASGSKVRELFLLAGRGKTSISIENPYHLKQASYDRLCLQADFANLSRKVGIVLSPRLLLLHFYKETNTYYSTDFALINNNFIFSELAFSLRYTPERHLTISPQLCATLPLAGKGIKNNYYKDFSPFNASIGLILNLDLFKSNP
jgi:hypothetical protein